MKLLRSARIHEYPTLRVRAAAVDLFHLAAPDWQSARGALLRAGFLRLGDLEETGKRALAPTADVYLDEAVPDYPALDENPADFWLALEQSMARRQVADALNSLGVAFVERPLGNLHANKQHAEACFCAALEVRTRQGDPTGWAMTQNNCNLPAAIANLPQSLAN